MAPVRLSKTKQKSGQTTKGLSSVGKSKVTQARVTKEKTGVKKRRNGLLNTTIPAKSNLMKIAKRNSLESPLLLLPPEIRNKIWSYALGGHHIHIEYSSFTVPSSSTYRSMPWDYSMLIFNSIYNRKLNFANFVKPRFTLSLVCRQLYVETSLIPYMMNKFSFSSLVAMNFWIKNRNPAQKRAVRSLVPNFEYLDRVKRGSRKHPQRYFPNLKHIDMTDFAWYYGSSTQELKMKLEKLATSPLKVDCDVMAIPN